MKNIIFVKQIKNNNMKNFNTEMSIEEATQLFTFKGQIFFVDNAHNRKIMAMVLHNHLQKLKSSK